MKMGQVANLCVSLLFCFTAASAFAAPVILYEGTAEYGWSHSGSQSWGGNWTANARNIVISKIRKEIGSMVNLRQLDSYVGKNVSRSITGAGRGTYGYGEGSLSYVGGKSSVQKQRWLNGNNYLIDVANVRLKPGTAYSKTKGDFWGNSKSWDASATFLYDYRVYGNDIAREDRVATNGGAPSVRSANYTTPAPPKYGNDNRFGRPGAARGGSKSPPLRFVFSDGEITHDGYGKWMIAGRGMSFTLTEISNTTRGAHLYEANTNSHVYLTRDRVYWTANLPYWGTGQPVRLVASGW